MELHQACAPIAFLLGTWKGVGEGHYPSIESFEYLEEVNFGHVGKPFLSYSQKTKHAATGQPLHAETGYLRAVGGDLIELVVVQPSGIIESHQGRVVANALELTLEHVHTTPSAKSVTNVERSIAVKPDSEGVDVLTYDLEMAAVGYPMTHHLHAELRRQPAD